MSDPRHTTLVLGGHGTGKTTLLAQLYGRMQSNDSQLRIVEAPDSLTPVLKGLTRLTQGRPVSHTESTVKVVQELTAETSDGDRFEVAIPDYAGETLDAVVNNRRIPEWWLSHCVESTRWLLLIRVERMEEIPDFASEDSQSAATSEDAAPPEDSGISLPLDMRLVELLQILSLERMRLADAVRPFLAVVLSCWDEIQLDTDSQKIVPAKILAKRMPLFSAFCETNWPGDGYAVFGLSAQGRPLDAANPDEEFVDKGPERMGYLIRPDGSQTGDLTELLLL